MATAARRLERSDGSALLGGLIFPLAVALDFVLIALGVHP